MPKLTLLELALTLLALEARNAFAAGDDDAFDEFSRLYFQGGGNVVALLVTLPGLRN